MKGLDGVVLQAYNREGELIAAQELSTYEWYEDLHPLIDDPHARKAKGVVMLRGWQYNDDGSLRQYWVSEYDESGEMVGCIEPENGIVRYVLRDGDWTQVEPPTKPEEEDEPSTQLQLDL